MLRANDLQDLPPEPGSRITGSVARREEVSRDAGVCVVIMSTFVSDPNCKHSAARPQNVSLGIWSSLPYRYFQLTEKQMADDFRQRKMLLHLTRFPACAQIKTERFHTCRKKCSPSASTVYLITASPREFQVPVPPLLFADRSRLPVVSRRCSYARCRRGGTWASA